MTVTERVTERVKETASDVVDALREAVDELRDEVGELKEKVTRAVRREDGRGNVPIRRRSAGTPAIWRSPWEGFFAPFRPAVGDMAGWDPFGGLYWPRVDVDETEDEVHVRIELPGVEQEELDLRLEHGALTVMGEKRSESRSDDHGWHYHECAYGAFRRRIPLPSAVDADRVRARFDRGVLHVTAPKAETRRGRLIPIRRS